MALALAPLERQRARSDGPVPARRGQLASLAAKGVPQLTIQLMGRWDSSIYRAYTRVSRGQALRYSAALSRDDVHDPSLEALFPGYRQASTR